MPASRRQQKPKALSSVTSPYNFRPREKYSKRATWKDDTLKRQTKASIRKPDVHSKKATTTTKIPASAGRESLVVSKNELLENFTNSLDDTRTAIRRDLELSLVQKEEDALDLLMKRYSSTQQNIGRLSHGEGGGSGEEGVPAPDFFRTGKSKQLGQSLAVVIPPSDSLQNLRDKLDANKRELDGLWKEWGKTQQKLVSLGVQVLGPARFNILEDQIHGSFKKRLNSAKACYQESEEGNEDLQHSFHEDVGSIKDLSKKAIAKSKTQAKAWRDEKRRYWEAMRDLAQKLVSHS
ncbi:hypothetical protein TERG_04639 [Paecilomyces variotii No. 5]|uniref:Uncharacterized protein n=1 Tax=Byssochlamys spectabilis (strain No. 5 / NBRC 109023) TaxID=1356009 RepID=V5G0G8_BYSSN|nr:hypothetical protein TERG_04639 [Paecilomyces variotii No. 5]